LVVIDSIQAIYSDNSDALPGMPSQIRECCSKLMRAAKSINVPIFLVGHINKDGDIAGPKILEHMVDTVIQFEGAKDSSIRFIRAIKNRFGDTNEIGLFTMNGEGLQDLSNPSEIFLEERSSGVIYAYHEARRSLLLEMQALVINSNYPNPRRLANGIELNRLHQILAVIEKKLDINVSKADVYLNVVGGIYIKDTSADLAIALAIYKSAMNYSNADSKSEVIAIGELGLNGEIRSVNNCENRIKEAQRLGFKRILIPQKNYSRLDIKNYSIEIIPVTNINAVMEDL
jgi:DNA repair protein RadA/Sms